MGSFGEPRNRFRRCSEFLRASLLTHEVLPKRDLVCELHVATGELLCSLQVPTNSVRPTPTEEMIRAKRVAAALLYPAQKTDHAVHAFHVYRA